MFSETNYWHKNKYFIRSFIVLQAQKQVAPYAKFACLDACHLTGKFKGMLICAKNQDSNGTIFILARGLVPREDEENWLYFLRHFQNAGLANSITFFMSDRDKGLINAVSKVFDDIPHSKCLHHLSKNFKKSMANKMQIFYNKWQDPTMLKNTKCILIS